MAKAMNTDDLHLEPDQVDSPAQLESEGARWWKDFIEHWVARGVDRGALQEAVGNFRAAQESLNDALNR